MLRLNFPVRSTNRSPPVRQMNGLPPERRSAPPSRQAVCRAMIDLASFRLNTESKGEFYMTKLTLSAPMLAIALAGFPTLAAKTRQNGMSRLLPE
jgi:hypothetical protein